MENDIDYILEQVNQLLAIDSPSGFTSEVVKYLVSEYQRLGYDPVVTEKGSVLVELGGEGDPIVLSGHVDTLGAMVAEIKNNGRLRISPVGGLNANNTETENCRIYTYDHKVYTGTIQLTNASTHVNGEYNKTERTFQTVELLLDEPVFSKEDVKKLGIMNGNYVCVDPRTVITPSGYIKSRFLDDKLSVAIAFGIAKYIQDNKIVPKRKIWLHVTVYEEIGHGASASVPEGVTEGLSVDMGCVGEGLECTEREVSIAAKDSGGPYSYETVSALIEGARREGAEYRVDVYPHYGSDVETTLCSGYDIRHGLIGPGVFASHSYERSHVDGVMNTLLVLKGYLGL